MSDSESLPQPSLPEGGVVPGRAPIPPVQRRKLYFMKELIHGRLPPPQVDTSFIANALAIAEGVSELVHHKPRIYRDYTNYVKGKGGDEFRLQAYGGEVANSLFAGTQNIDMADLAMAMRSYYAMCQNVLVDVFLPLQGRDTTQQSARFSALWPAVAAELVQAVPMRNLFGDELFDFRRAYGMLSEHSEGRQKEVEESILSNVEYAIRERLIISELVVSGGLYYSQEEPGLQGRSQYAYPAALGEIDRINEAAADTMEGIHLLKAYGIKPFEVAAERLDLPWDIAVIPPLYGDRADEYAPGALADFLLLDPQEGRTDSSLHANITPGLTAIRLGDAKQLMRFRLHDNGQISHGLVFHNVPGNVTERVFMENLASDAFVRLRGLLIAFAFDALVPDEVVAGEEIGGGAAHTFRPRTPGGIGARIENLLRRRRKILRQAKVSPSHRNPIGWPAPRTEVDGYRRRLAPGTRRRDNAEEEAFEYFKSRRLPFDGLKDDETFAKPYDRGSGPKLPVFRGAYFRNNSATTQYLEALGVQSKRRKR